jgi:hypothetical protein
VRRDLPDPAQPYHQGVSMESAPRIVKTCEVCGKEKVINPSRITGKTFFTCSKTCQYIMTGKLNKERWNNLTEEQREKQINRFSIYHKNKRIGFDKYWSAHNEKMLEHTVSVMKDHKGMVKDHERAGLNISKNPCILLKAHAILLKDDPERLTSDFCQNLMGRKCKDHDAHKTNLQRPESKEDASERLNKEQLYKS